MPNLELYFMRYCDLKNCDIFTKLISKSSTCFESHSHWEEIVSHSPSEGEVQRKWARQWDQDIEGNQLRVGPSRGLEGSVWAARAALAHWGLLRLTCRCTTQGPSGPLM